MQRVREYTSSPFYHRLPALGSSVYSCRQRMDLRGLLISRAAFASIRCIANTVILPATAHRRVVVFLDTVYLQYWLARRHAAAWRSCLVKRLCVVALYTTRPYLWRLQPSIAVCCVTL